MGQSQNTELQVFSGGLNLRVEPHLIQPTEARRLSNVDIRSFALKPFREPEFVQLTTQPFMFFFANKFWFYDRWRSNITWNNVWYWSDSGNLGKTFPDGTSKPLGIAPPVTRPTVAETTPSEGDGLTGTYNYVYTYYEPNTGAESPPSPPSADIAVDGKAIVVSDFEQTTDYEIRIYRIGGVLTAYSAVSTESGQIVEFEDYYKYTEIEATILDTTRSFPPPAGAQYLTEHQGRFYCALGTSVYFSAPGKPDSWYLLDSIQVEEPITMLASVANGLLIASRNKTWVLTGLDPINFAKYLISESDGCIAAQSLAVLDGQAIWLGQNSFLASSGANVQDISSAKIGSIKGLDPRSATIYNRAYLCSFSGTLVPSNELIPGPDGGPDDDPDVGDLVPGSTSGSLALKEGAVIIDFSFGNPVFSTIALKGLGDLGYYDGYLYGITNPETEPSNIVTEDATSNIITESGLFNIVAEVPASSASVNRLFNGVNLSRIDYASPLLTDGSIGMLKQYEKIRITYVGDIEVTVISDNWDTMQHQRLSSTRRTSEWLGIPVSSNRAYGIRINIKGLGTVDSILYTWTPWEAQ